MDFACCSLSGNLKALFKRLGCDLLAAPEGLEYTGFPIA